MGTIERLRLLDARGGMVEKENLDDWDGGEKEEWDAPQSQFPGAGLGRGYSTYSTLSKRLGQVRTGDWGIPGSKKPSSLRNFE